MSILKKKTRAKAATTTTKKAPKKTARKTSKKKKSAAGKGTVSPEERFRMIQTSAYYEAEQDGFQGNPTDYWTLAEKKISNLLDN